MLDCRRAILAGLLGRTELMQYSSTSICRACSWDMDRQRRGHEFPASNTIPSGSAKEWCARSLPGAAFAMRACLMPCGQCRDMSLCPEPFRRRLTKIIRCRLARGKRFRSLTLWRRCWSTLRCGPTDRVLEVGTGSGYVTALLAVLCAEVFSVERHASLANSAEATLRRLGYSQCAIRVGDGRLGGRSMRRSMPFLFRRRRRRCLRDLFAQLREGGRMILPVGPSSSQELQLIRRPADRLR